MGHENKVLDQTDIILLKLMETTKDLLNIAELLLKDPSGIQKAIMIKKISKLREALPRTTSDVKAVTRRKDLRTLSLRSFKGETNDDGAGEQNST